MKVVIVGGGVMGLLQARELSLLGIDVCLVDKGLCGTEASWAGGGIVSPLYPWRYSAPITTLATWSQAYYPNLIQALEAESDLDPELTRHGMLMLSVDDEEAAMAWSDSHHPAWIEAVERDRIYELEPNLREGCDSALWMPHIGSVRNPRLLRALKRILDLSPNVEILEKQPFAALWEEKSVVKGIKTGKGDFIEADKIIFCSGAWTANLLDDAHLDIEPVKGQMLVFAAKPGLVNRVVLSAGKYVIPRRDGHVLAGSTLEHTGFDKSTSDEAKETLSDIAIDLFPELARYPITHHWSGLRPGSPEGLPYIGRVPDYENVYVNAGHYRNGLVLAPASVKLMSCLIGNETPPFDPTPYAPSGRLNRN